MIPTASVLHRQDLIFCVQKLWCETSEKANMVMSTASVFAALHTVEASEVTQRSRHQSKAAFNATYKYSYPVGARNNGLWAYGCGLYASSQMYSSIQAYLLCFFPQSLHVPL